MIRIDRKVLLEITDCDNERNIYTHPLFLARDIFWQRLEYAYKYIKLFVGPEAEVLDFGGGSGVFSKSLSNYFEKVSIIDLDTKDAYNIKEYFKLNNVEIHTQDISEFDSERKFDLITATDVLEHFENLAIPQEFFNRYMKENGYLLVTLPTENFIYELGRLVINKQKPIDHYHKSSEVIDFLLNNGFELVQKQFVPKYIVPIPLFEVAIFKFKGSYHG